jgi:HAD superfamily hydrolase (TIGR01490 family)
MKKKKVAIFDIDGTIFRSSLLIELTEKMLDDGIISSGVREVYAHAYENWANRKDSYEKYIKGVIDAFEGNIKGIKYSDMEKAARQVIYYHKHRVYRYTRDLAKELKKKGYYLLAISKSPKNMVEEFCKNLGFDKTYGIMYEIDEKRLLTGKTLHVDLIFDKAKILKRAVEKENLTLKGSVGVGDSESDVAFLELVDRPICFNPNSLLFEKAKRNGWEVVIERKNIAYKVSPKSVSAKLYK